KTLIILNFVTRELWKFNFSKENFSKENFGKENFGKENFGKENFGKVLNFAEVEEVKKFQTLPKLRVNTSHGFIFLECIIIKQKHVSQALPSLLTFGASIKILKT
ncbi:hypothetical protein, partial [Cloacibacterium sp.]|uniref:hypothetical protein n=1 Tax=Cloacibacterium sp. TaxID=1913682 RepID=UPI00352E5CEF